LGRLALGPRRPLSSAKSLSPESPLARIAVIVRPEALEALRAPFEALLGAGHAVHLGLTGDGGEAALTQLWNAWPALSLGHAVPRRDRWAHMAPGLAPGLAAALPPDPGIMTYLAQLDLDLLLLGEPAQAGKIEAEYLNACRRLGLPAAVIGPTAEEAMAQAQPGAVRASASEAVFQRPLLWGLWMVDELTRPAAPGAAGQGRGGVAQWIGETYAGRVFPPLAAATAALAPAGHPLAKADLAERLDRGLLANELAAEQAMAQAAEGHGPIAIGPWWDDPDLEILYWAPFVRWWRRRYQVDRDRIVVVSGGGSGAWYDGALGQHLDLAELHDPLTLADLRKSRAEELSNRNKRFGTTEADRQLLKRLNRRLGFKGLTTLSPWTMAATFERYWSGQAGPALLADRTRAHPLKMKAKRARQLAPGLPEAFVAVGLPDRLAADSELRMGVKAAIRRVAERTGVVLLAEPGVAEWAGQLGGGAIQVLALEARAGKATASAVMAAASGYLGPSGWMAYAAAAYGTPAVCLTAGPDERELIDLATAARLFSPAPLLVGVAEPAAAGLEWLLTARESAEPAH